MATKKSIGTCGLCGRKFAKAAMAHHLTSCVGTQEGIGPPHPESGSNQGGYHLVVEGRSSPQYWLHLAVSARAGLADLDAFLRDIWLECCGHLSAFTINGTTYAQSPMREFGQRSMTRRVSTVLSPGLRFSYVYDFGSSTELSLRVAGVLAGGPAKIIGVLARNDPPDIACAECGRPAAFVCTECQWKGEGWLCDACAQDHECGEEMRLPVVNSPRVGVCGYTGQE